jgi:hypothetical protein
VRRRPLLLRGPLVALLLAGVVAGTAGCSSSDDAGGTTTSKSPEDVLASDARVASGLANLGTLAAGAAEQAASGAKSAKSSTDRLESQWQPIEGRIKKNDAAAYLKFEDALSDLRAGAHEGDAAKIRRGAAAVTALSTAYLAEHPG